MVRAFFVVIAGLLLTMIASAQVSRTDWSADQLRKKHLQESGKQWFISNILPMAERSYPFADDDFSVFVTEPDVILPADLGGPLNVVAVTLEVHFNSYIEDYDGFDQSVICIYKQKLNADLDKKLDRPTQISKGQRPQALITCGDHVIPSTPRWW